jgi:hypothetical protein
VGLSSYVQISKETNLVHHVTGHVHFNSGSNEMPFS